MTPERTFPASIIEVGDGRPPCVLFAGKDARTDALAAACQASRHSPELYGVAEMRLPGLVDKCVEVFERSLTDPGAFESIVRQVKPDLVVIGPEEPLGAGFVDVLDGMGIPAVGPSAELAQLETSKSWTRALLAEFDIAGNPRHKVFTSTEGLLEYLTELGDFVIKPDGLTAGKGVRVFGEHIRTIDEAMDYAQSLLNTGPQLVIEERLVGQEFSLQTFTDGCEVLHFPVVQDHKRAFEGDSGPNTGGMGSYSDADFSLPFLEDSDLEAAKHITEQVVRALGERFDRPYRGVLYGGFIAVEDGVRLIEYNARFGDPEAMNVLPLIETDFLDLCWSVATGTLDPSAHSFASKATVCKYIVPRNYPEPSPGDEEIAVPDELLAREDLHWYWAACREQDGRVLMSSSRAGAFVGIGDSLVEAERVAEEAAELMERNFPAVRHRSDIGRPQVIEERVAQMRRIRQAAPVASG